MRDQNTLLVNNRWLSKVCWLVAVCFALTTGLLAYMFLWKGETLPASDGRLAIQLAPGERDLVLAEMRAFLQAVQGIASGVKEEDSQSVATVARQVGASAQQAVPTSLVGKLPGDFKVLGFDTHRKFDQLALDAEQLGDPMHSLEQLTELMNNCVACHAAYRIDATK
jgi:cytochrome c556